MYVECAKHDQMCGIGREPVVGSREMEVCKCTVKCMRIGKSRGSAGYVDPSIITYSGDRLPNTAADRRQTSFSSRTSAGASSYFSPCRRLPFMSMSWMEWNTLNRESLLKSGSIAVLSTAGCNSPRGQEMHIFRPADILDAMIVGDLYY